MDSYAIAFADPKDSRTISGMDGPHRSGPDLTLCINAYGPRAGAGNTGPIDGLAKHAGGAEAVASASPNHSIGWTDSEYTRRTRSLVGT